MAEEQEDAHRKKRHSINWLNMASLVLSKKPTLEYTKRFSMVSVAFRGLLEVERKKKKLVEEKKKVFENFIQLPARKAYYNILNRC